MLKREPRRAAHAGAGPLPSGAFLYLIRVAASEAPDLTRDRGLSCNIRGSV